MELCSTNVEYTMNDFWNMMQLVTWCATRYLTKYVGLILCLGSWNLYVILL